MAHFETDEDYFRYRHSKIGASDSNIIMGVSKHTSFDDLVITKALPFKPNDKNSFVRNFGLKYEEEQREHLNSIHGLNLVAQCIESTELPFMLAALDGFDEEKGIIWEHKVVGVKNGMFDEIKESQKVPECYYPQVQHQMYVCNADKMLFQATAKGDKKSTCFEVERNEDYIRKELIPTILKFCKAVSTLKAELSQNKTS